MLNISQEQKRQVPSLKPGERAVFRLLGIRYDKELKREICPGSVRIPATDRIWDIGNEDWVDMSLIERIVPNSDRNSLIKETVVTKDVLFERSNKGEIVCVGGKKDDEDLYVYLYLSNFCKNNVGKGTFVRTPSGPRYELLTPGNDALKILELDQKVLLAGQIIHGMDETKLRTIAKGLGLRGVGQYTDPNTIKVKLIELSKKRDWVDRILGLDEDVSIEVIALIKDAQDANLIIADRGRGAWKWSGSTDNIAPILPGKSPEESLKDYLITEGQSVLEAIQRQLLGIQEDKQPEIETRTSIDADAQVAVKAILDRKKTKEPIADIADLEPLES